MSCAINDELVDKLLNNFFSLKKLIHHLLSISKLSSCFPKGAIFFSLALPKNIEQRNKIKSFKIHNTPVWSNWTLLTLPEAEEAEEEAEEGVPFVWLELFAWLRASWEIRQIVSDDSAGWCWDDAGNGSGDFLGARTKRLKCLAGRLAPSKTGYNIW